MLVVYFWHNESALISAARSISALFAQLLMRSYGLLELFLKPLDYFLTFISCFYNSNGAPEEDP